MSTALTNFHISKKQDVKWIVLFCTQFCKRSFTILNHYYLLSFTQNIGQNKKFLAH